MEAKKRIVSEINKKNYSSTDGFLEIVEDLVLSLENYLKYKRINICIDSNIYYNNISRPICFFFSNGSCENCFLHYNSNDYYSVLKEICKISSTPYFPLINKAEIVLNILGMPQPYYENNRILSAMGKGKDFDWSKDSCELYMESENYLGLVYSFSVFYNVVLTQGTDDERIAILNKVIGTANREIKRIDDKNKLDKKLKK